MDKLVVGVIGLGMGALHLKGAIEGGAEIALICDTDPEKLKKVGRQFVRRKIAVSCIKAEIAPDHVFGGID